MTAPLTVTDETNAWILAYQRGERHYGYAKIDDNFEVIVVVQQEDQRTVNAILNRRGFAVWRGINADPRVRRKIFHAAFDPDDRVVWEEQELRTSRPTVCIKICVPPRDETLRIKREADRSHPFKICMDGVVTLANKGGAQQCGLQFNGICGGGNIAMNRTDMLAATLEALRAVPGLGDLIGGPILRLYDAQQEEQLRQEIADLHLVTKETLRAVLHLSTLVKSGEVEGEKAELALDAISVQLNRVYSKVPKLSKWPLLLSREVIFAEINILFENDVQPLRVALASSGFRVRGHDCDEMALHFMNQIIGSPQARVASVFEALRADRPASQILDAVVQAIKSSSPQ